MRQPNILKAVQQSFADSMQSGVQVTGDTVLADPYLTDFLAFLQPYNPLRRAMNLPDQPDLTGKPLPSTGGLTLSEIGMSTDAVAYWEPVSGDPTPGTVGTFEKAPAKAALLICVLELSAANFQDYYGVADRLVFKEAARVMGLAEQKELLTGDGTGSGITGLANLLAISKTSYSSSVVDELLDLGQTLEEAGSPWNAVLMAPREVNSLRKLKDATAGYAFSLAAPLGLAGRPILNCSQIPKTGGSGSDSWAAIGDFSWATILHYGGVRVGLDRFSNIMTGKVRIRFSFYTGLSVTPGHVDDFKILDGIS
jgi:HK97 family phage major capsid protein